MPKSSRSAPVPTPASAPPEGPNQIWARLPVAAKAGKPGGRLCGLARSTLIELAERGYFRMALIKQPNRQRYIRLVHLPSLHAYLEGATKRPTLQPGRTGERSKAK
jgi:hypothetical protein